MSGFLDRTIEALQQEVQTRTVRIAQLEADLAAAEYRTVRIIALRLWSEDNTPGSEPDDFMDRARAALEDRP